MKTRIKSKHYEEVSDDKSRALGVLLNQSLDNSWDECLFYIFNNETQTYIFFKFMSHVFKYLIGETNIERAYIDEDDFDKYYDAEFIDGEFSNKLKWS